MKNSLILLILCCQTLACYSQSGKAAADTAFSHASGMEAATLNEDNIEALTTMGMLWGFVKYYHAGVQNGDYNMDAELFRILPKVITADSAAALGLMNTWVDGFSKPALCKTCADFKKTPNTKLAPDYGYLFDKAKVPQTLIDKLTYIRKNRSQSTQHYYVVKDEGLGYPKFKNENSYKDNTYPDAGVRLLALYRYWNMVQYFYPNRHLIGEDWNKVLTEFIPLFYNAKNAREYQLACLKLIARIHDTQATIWGGSAEIEEAMGTLMSPVDFEFAEGKFIVAGYYVDTLDVSYSVKPGNIVEKIDDVPIDELVKKYQPLTPASNYETQLRDLPGKGGFLLRGSKQEFDVTLNREGKYSVSTLPRVPVSRIRPKTVKFGVADTAYKMIKGNIGYIYPGLLREGDMDSIKNKFATTKGIIIDLRCRPSMFMPYSFGNWFKTASTAFVRPTFCSTDMPGQFEMGDKMTNGGNGSVVYKGKVVVIVNAETQGQAEYAVMALQSAPNVTVIGNTTAGAAGNLSDIVLPGGIKTMFSGTGALYPDGTETQRKGVKINKVVKPTIKGITENRDELLEEAVKMIKG